MSDSPTPTNEGDVAQPTNAATSPEAPQTTDQIVTYLNSPDAEKIENNDGLEITEPPAAGEERENDLPVTEPLSEGCGDAPIVLEAKMIGVVEIGADSAQEEDPVEEVYLPPFRAIRAEIAKKQFGLAVGMSLFVLIMFCLFLGAQWDSQSLIPSIPALISNQDAGPFGAIVSAGFEAGVGVPGVKNFDWTVTNDVDVAGARDLLAQGKYWVVVTIPPTFSSKILAVANATASAYSNPVTWVMDDGFQPSLSSTLRLNVNNISRIVNRKLASSVFAYPGMNRTRATSKSIFAAPLQMVESNLHPSQRSGFNMLSSLTYMFVSGLCTVFTTKMMTALGDIFKKAKLYQSFLLCLFISICFSAMAVSIFQGILAGFLLDGASLANFSGFWALNFVTFLSFIGIFKVCNQLGPIGGAISGVINIFQSATSGSLVPVSLATPFYKVGAGFPMFHGVQGSRTMIFGSFDNLSVNFGSIIAWWVGTEIVFFCLFVKNQTKPKASPASTEKSK